VGEAKLQLVQRVLLLTPLPGVKPRQAEARRLARAGPRAQSYRALRTASRT
jgi:hypothetical protein